MPLGSVTAVAFKNGMLTFHEYFVWK